ncbi:MAG TPA: mitochondrial fission ELM1 family protein [Gammaproteobacteria bacterium]|nr:mitochondrial fission ELM1 family protein [Gammaproteobacteria bacterium]
MTTCWLLCEDKAGMINQARGLAEAAGLEPVLKRVTRRAPWKYLPPSLWLAPLKAAGPGSDALTPPWPDVLIASGRYTVALTLAIRRYSGGRTFCVYIQDPKVNPRRFDMVVVPEHDPCRGANVLTTRGALHRVTPERLAAAAEGFRPSLAELPHPRVAVLLGGNNRYYRLTPELATELARQLADLAHTRGAGFAITPSRRTDPQVVAALRTGLAGLPATVWDGQGDNPYFGYLALADVILVTADSVSMVSEACSTGKPVYVIELAGGGAKFRAFHAGLQAAGCTRPFTGALDSWEYPPLDDTARVAAELRRRLAVHRQALGVGE